MALKKKTSKPKVEIREVVKFKDHPTETYRLISAKGKLGVGDVFQSTRTVIVRKITEEDASGLLVIEGELTKREWSKTF